jgi:type IV secretory pathway VirB6-like protein
VTQTKKESPDTAPSPVHMQRAAFTAVLSFLFFLGMMFAYYILQSTIYFLLATAFLIVYVLTMISLYRLRRR